MNAADATEKILERLTHHRNNADFLANLTKQA